MMASEPYRRRYRPFFSSTGTHRVEAQAFFDRNQQDHLINRGLLEQSQGSLEQILQLVTKLSMKDQASGSVVEGRDSQVTGTLTDKSSQPAKRESCQELMGCITRLCRLVDNMHPLSRVISRDTQNVKDEILRALELIRSETIFQAGVMSNMIDPSTCAICCGSHTDHLQESLTTTYSAFLSAHRVLVNDGGRHLSLFSHTYTS